MPDFDQWVGQQLSTSKAARRAAIVGVRIEERPTSIVITGRPGGNLAAQIVRLEPLETSNPDTDITEVGASVGSKSIILGYKNHPTETDTDLQQGDTFMANGQHYVVESVINSLPDRLVALAERR